MESIQIPKELFIRNRSKLKELLLPGASLVLFANDEMPRNGDQFFKYRQSSDFFYLTGINQEKSVLVMNPGHPDEKHREVLFILRSTPEMETWNGHKLTKDEASGISGIGSVQFLDDYEKLLSEIVHRSNDVYLNLPENPKITFEYETRDIRLSKKIRNFFPLHSYHRLAPLIQKLRMRKESWEVDQLRKSCDITRDAFIRTMQFIKPGVMEYEVEAEIIHEFIKQGAMGHAYEPIVASGVNACFLHYTDNIAPCRDRELVLMDIGSEYHNYAADLSRTIPVNGKFSKRQAELYDALLDVFYHAREMMKPGVVMADFHEKVCRLMQQAHIKVGLYSAKDVKSHQGPNPIWFRYYMHGTSHSIGLDVHDVFDKTVTFAPGMVFSCEPGIYIPEEKTGIRIENDILITEKGNEDLMADIPIEREEIEKIMR